MKPADATRARLLEAAGRVFADRGYRLATVREIVRRARVNLAAVNYHYGGKERLYRAVLESGPCAVREGLERSAPGGPPERRLRDFVRTFFTRMVATPDWAGRLIARELSEPTRQLDLVVRSVMRPVMGRLEGIVAELLPGAAPATVRLAARSVLAQCVFYRNAAPILERLEHPPRFPRDAAAVAEHVSEFSLGALRAMSRGSR